MTAAAVHGGWACLEHAVQCSQPATSPQSSAQGCLTGHVWRCSSHCSVGAEQSSRCACLPGLQLFALAPVPLAARRCTGPHSRHAAAGVCMPKRWTAVPHAHAPCQHECPCLGQDLNVGQGLMRLPISCLCEPWNDGSFRRHLQRAHDLHIPPAGLRLKLQLWAGPAPALCPAALPHGTQCMPSSGPHTASRQPACRTAMAPALHQHSMHPAHCSTL